MGLQFGESPAGQTRLFSVGADRRLVEYDLAAAAAHGAGLRARTLCDCVAPGAAGTPCALTFAPPVPYFDSHASTATLLLVAGGGASLGGGSERQHPGEHACMLPPKATPAQRARASSGCRRR